MARCHKIIHISTRSDNPRKSLVNNVIYGIAFELQVMVVITVAVLEPGPEKDAISTRYPQSGKPCVIIMITYPDWRRKQNFQYCREFVLETEPVFL